MESTPIFIHHQDKASLPEQVDYWVDHVSNAVRFAAGMEALENARSPEVFLEIGQEPWGLAEMEIQQRQIADFTRWSRERLGTFPKIWEYGLRPRTTFFVTVFQ